MSFVTLKTNNCMYAAIIHGAVNIIGETPIFISLFTQSVLLGPNPSGVIGMSVLLKCGRDRRYRLPVPPVPYFDFSDIEKDIAPDTMPRIFKPPDAD